jgi:fatty-acyl-CoA synthase
MSHHFEPAETLGAIEKHSVTLGATSPLILQMLAEDPEFPKTDLSSLRCLVVGGGPVSTELLDVFMARGVRLTQGYGMTETTAVATFLPLSATRSKLGSAGVPLPGIEVDIVDLSGVRQAAGAVGEILVRGPNVMAGYWGGPAGPTSAVDSDGWLHTGDAGYLDTDGHLYVVDRIKDMIISGGLNVYAAEVEQVLQRHPAVREIAVIGLPDTTYGEAVTAVIALQPGFTVTLDELRAAGRSDLAGYKLPRRVELCESLPRNANGKVLKAQLRERLTAGDASGAAR